MRVEKDKIRSFAGEVLGISDRASLDVTPLPVKGSQRSFYRVSSGSNKVIFMSYDCEPRENSFFAELALFLKSLAISVPRIFYHDRDRRFLLMEDLGDADLWHYRGAPWEIRRELYRKTLSGICKIHALRPTVFFPVQAPMMEPFNADLYRWEHSYFLNYFVKDVCQIEPGEAETEALKKELLTLVEGFEGMSSSLIHRDLQSQNVMICNGEPVFIDFQGMRWGNLFYDLGSLLYDPYVFFTDEERQELLLYYYGLSEAGYNFALFRKEFRKASVQRLMQALGAYGYLGLKRGRRGFLAYIPSGLDNLVSLATADSALRRLGGLCLRCREIVEQKGVTHLC